MKRGLAVVVIALLAACGGGDDERPNVIRAGQADIQLPEGWTVTEQGATRPAADGSEVAAPASGGGEQAATATGGEEPTADTVPLAQDDPQTAFFEAVGVFTQCLDERGESFIGIPDSANPASPTNDPAYVESLGTCASKSNILQALQDIQKFEDELTAEEIEERNESYLVWRDCMIDRGWGIPEPKPDEKGRLFTLGSAGTTGPQFEPPPGETLFESDDFGACLEEAAG